MSDLYHHPNLPITAEAHYWQTLGYSVYTDSDRVGAGPHDGTELLILALGTGKVGRDAITWALAERRRRCEEDSRSSAISAEGAGLAKLAAALRDASEEDVLRKLLGRLTERTQYAVRQQLSK